jgi:protein-S-isoprenylcysteine O-methyltransferase Ste14
MNTMFRWIALAVFVASLAISAYRRRRARQATGTIPRAQEPRGLIAGRLLVALPLFGAVVAYLVNPRWMAWASFGLPSWARWIGAALGVLVVPFSWWVLTSLGSNVSETVLTKERHQLVTAGPYRFVRHPLYLDGIVLFASIGLMAANWFILLFTALVVIGVRAVIIPQEEENLIAAFGDVYRDYRTATGALLPVPPRGGRHG